mmetsp:Transcript_15632/g.17902  ORF Transcript_15632/g.17902 Transcript_15632/m.17902 type:complete len:124 (+) Transcript_15632:216-587(+)
MTDHYSSDEKQTNVFVMESCSRDPLFKPTATKCRVDTHIMCISPAFSTSPPLPTLSLNKGFPLDPMMVVPCAVPNNDNDEEGMIRLTKRLSTRLTTRPTTRLTTRLTMRVAMNNSTKVHESFL